MLSTPDEAALFPLAVNDADAAKLVRCSRSHWRRMVAAGKAPPPTKLGKLSRWPVAQLQRWLEMGSPSADKFAARDAR
jgi:predicted DNA-binding transcriptional regulator AlpA